MATASSAFTQPGRPRVPAAQVGPGIALPRRSSGPRRSPAEPIEQLQMALPSASAPLPERRNFLKELYDQDKAIEIQGHARGNDIRLAPHSSKVKRIARDNSNCQRH